MLLSRLNTQAPTEQRARTFNDIIDIIDGLGGIKTSSGAVVTDMTAMQQATVYSCVWIISECIAMLPIELKRRVGGRVEDVESHPALDLLAQPNAWQTQHEFIAHQVQWFELRGNGYAIKSRDGRGRVRRLIPLRGDEVTPDQLDDFSIVYRLSGERSGEFDPSRVFHIRNWGPDSYVGASRIANARESIGLAMRTEEHGATLFKHGGSIGKVLEHPASLSDEAAMRLRKRLQDFSGAENAGKTFVAEEGMQLKSVAMTSEDAQYLETRKFQKEEIASLFQVPLFLLNGQEKSTTWGSGLEQISRGFLRFSLGPRFSRITQALNRELLLPGERRDHFFMFDTDRFSLGDFKERMEGYAAGISAGVINPNEARERDGLNPREGGDIYRETPNSVPEGQSDETETPE